jgi:serine/threonine protein kinase
LNGNNIGPIPDTTIDKIFKREKTKGLQKAIDKVRDCLMPLIQNLPDIKDGEKDISGKVLLANKLGNEKGSSLIFHGYVKRKGTPELVVVKAFNTNYLAEVEFGLKCDHPNVIKPIGVACMNVRFAKMVCLVLPLFTYTSLKDYIIKQHTFDNNKKIEIFKQICRGLQYLHRNNIMHNDLKYDNIYVKNDGTPVISDFGNARFMYNFSKNMGTPTTKSPEVNARALFKEKADMFALGRVYEQIFSDFGCEYVLPFKKLIGDKLYVLQPNPQTMVVEEIELDISTDFATKEYTDNFTFLYNETNNAEKALKSIYLRDDDVVFVSKYEEAAAADLPFTSAKYLVFGSNKNALFGADEIFKNLLDKNPSKRWSAEQVLDFLGDTEYQKIGKDIPDDDVFEIPKNVNFVPGQISTIIIKKFDGSFFQAPFDNLFDSINKFDEIIHAHDVQEKFENYKRHQFSIYPKYVDLYTYFKFKSENITDETTREKFNWLAEYVQKNEGYFKPKQSSSFFGTWFKSFY